MSESRYEDLHATLIEQLSVDARGWLDEATARIEADPQSIRTLFPAAGRRCGRGPLVPPWTVDDAARTVLLAALPLRGVELANEVAALYRYGDAGEKRGVLRGLATVETGTDLAAQPDGLSTLTALVHDALRTNDTRLVAAALGDYGARRLAPDAYRQGVLKCVFVGVPLADIAGLPERGDVELARMLVDFARERVAAGRDVPTDVWLVADRHPEVVEASGLRDELSSEVPERREAAARALAGRGTEPLSHPPGEA